MAPSYELHIGHLGHNLCYQERGPNLPNRTLDRQKLLLWTLMYLPRILVILVKQVSEYRLLQSSFLRHCRTRLLDQQHNTLQSCLLQCPGTYSSPVSRTLNMCILVHLLIDMPCSRCSSLLSLDNKCLTRYSSPNSLTV